MVWDINLILPQHHNQVNINLVKNKMFDRSRRNLARWFTLSMGSVLVGFAALIFALETRDQLRAFDRALLNESRMMAAGIESEFHQGKLRINLENIPLLGEKYLGIDNDLVYARWYNHQGKIVRFLGDLPPEILRDTQGFQTVKNKSNQKLRQLTLPVFQENILLGYLQIATPLKPVEEIIFNLRLSLTIIVPLTAGIIALVGWFLGGLAMQPIRASYHQLQQFTADASHELRAPLAAILSNAQVGLLAPLGNDEQPRKRLKKIVELTKSMSGLVSHLLFLARHEGKLNTQLLQTINLTNLLQELANTYQSQLTEKNIRFNSVFPPEPVFLKAEADLLRQAVKNLLENAGKYTPAGGEIWLNLLLQNHRVFIQVEDTGLGIPTVDLPHIFQRFYRVDNARTKKTGGFGLGLAITQQIILAHGGTITATSIEGKGSIFQIELNL